MAYLGLRGDEGERSRWAKSRIIVVAQRMLRGEIGVIAGSRELSVLQHDVTPSLQADLRPFVGIASETDALPIGPEREHWAAEVLTRQDGEIERCETLYRGLALSACRTLLEKMSVLGSSD